MRAPLAFLLNALLFLVAWVATSVALAWASNHFLLETRDIPLGAVPWQFMVVVEEAPVAGAAPSFRWMRYSDLGERALQPGESLRLSRPAFEFPGTCCFAFKVLSDGADGQVVEFDADDMSYLRSRYRVHEGRVTPLYFRADFSLYWLGYLVAGGLLAWFGTARQRRRLRAAIVPALSSGPATG